MQTDNINYENYTSSILIKNRYLLENITHKTNWFGKTDWQVPDSYTFSKQKLISQDQARLF